MNTAGQHSCCQDNCCPCSEQWAGVSSHCPPSHHRTHFSVGFPLWAGESQVPFGDRRALMRVTACQGLVPRRYEGCRGGATTGPVGCVGRRGGGTGHRSAWLVPSSPVPTVSQGSGESSRRVITVRNNHLTYCTSPDAN